MQPINILIDLKTADALNKLNGFVESAASGLKRLASEALAAYVSFEGLHKLVEVGLDVITLQESIGKLGQQTGISIPFITALRSEAVTMGLDFQQLETTLGRFSASVYTAATTGGKARDGFRDMGVSLLNLDGSLRSTDDILKDFLIKFRQMPDGPQKTAVAMEISGRSARESIPFLNAAADAIENMGEKSPISPESVAQATHFNQTLRQLHESLELIFVEVVNRILPVLTDFAQSLLGASHEAENHKVAVIGLVDILKGLITAGVVVALAIYDIGKALGVVAAKEVENFRIAMVTVQLLVKDITMALKDELNLIIDIGSGLVAVFQAQNALLHGHLGEARDILADSFADIKGDVKALWGDAAKGVNDFGHGVSQVFENEKSVSLGFIDDIRAQWTNTSKFLGDLWGDKKSPAAPKSSAQPAIFPTATQDIKDLTTLQQIVSELYKQQEKMITTNPFATQSQKAAELIPLMEKQREILLDEILAFKKIYDQTADGDPKHLKALQDMVKVQGQLVDLDAKTAQLKGTSSFVDKFKQDAAVMAGQWSQLGSNLADGAFATIKQGVTGISDALTKMIMGTETAAQAFANMGLSILTSFISMILTQLLYAAIAIPILAILGVLTGGATAATGAGIVTASVASVAGIAGREQGGPVEAGMPYIVGERRPELFVPSTSGFIMPHVPSSRVGSPLGQSQPTQVNLAFHGGEADAQKWAKSQEGQTFIVNTNRKNVRRITRQ